MTVNGFMSVSLEPPLIVVSIARKTRLYEFLSKSQYYGVSVLDESQVRFSNHFAGRPDPTLDVAFITLHEGTPLLRDALAHMVARVIDAHSAGDHVLFIGQVEYVNYVDKRPLLFYMSDYNRLKSEPKEQQNIRFDDELTFYVPNAFDRS